MALSKEEIQAARQAKEQFLSNDELQAARASKPKKSSTLYESAVPAMGMEGGFSLAAGQGLWDAAGKIASGVGKVAAYLPDKIFGTNFGGSIPENLAPTPSVSTQQAIDQNPGARPLGEGLGIAGSLATPLGIESSIAKALANYKRFGGYAGRAAEFGTQTAVLDPENIPASFFLGGTIGAGSKAAESAIGYLPKAWKSLLGVKGTSEEAKRNLEAFQHIGATPQFGKVVNAPTINSLQSSMAYLPGSGQSPTFEGIGKAIKNNVGSVLKEIEPSSSKELNASLQEALKKADKVAEDTRKTNYAILGDYADEVKAKVQLSETVKNARSSYKELTKYSKESDEFKSAFKSGLLRRLDSMSKRKSKEEIDELKRASKISDPAKQVLDYLKDQNIALTQDSQSLVKEFKSAAASKNKELKKAKKDTVSFGAAMAMDRDLNKLINDAEVVGDTASTGYFYGLKNSLNEDINNAAASSGNQQLIDHWLEAKRQFSQEVVPIREPEIQKFVREKENNEKIIPTFLKGGQFEQPQFLDQLTRHLNSKQKQAIAHEYLTKESRYIKGEEELKEGKVLQNYEKMGDEVKKMLFTKKQRETLDNALITKRLMNTDLSQMVNPKTGASLSKIFGWTGLALSPITNPARRILSSEAIIKKYIEQMQKAEGKREAPIVRNAQGLVKPAARVFSPALAAFFQRSSNNK